MRPLALCIGILVAVLALYFLGRGSSVEERGPAAAPAPGFDDSAPAVAADAPSDDEVAADGPAVATRTPGRAETDVWQLLPLREAPGTAPKGCFVRGRVLDALTRAGLGGVELALEVHDPHTALPLLSAFSAADGSFAIEIPRQGVREWGRRLRDIVEERELAVLEAHGYAGKGAEAEQRLRQKLASGAIGPSRPSDLSFALRASTPGYVPRITALKLDPLADATHDVEILLDPGDTLRGRVLGILSEGIGGVEVHLVRAEDLERVSSTRTDPRGEYVLPMPVTGLYHVHARAEGHGAVVLQELALPPFGEGMLPDLLLRGEVRLSGYVHDPAGYSPEGVPLIAVPAEFAGLTPRAIPPDRQVYEEMRGGLFGSSQLTSGLGTFDIPYLASGSYVVRFADDPEGDTGPPVSAPATDLRLVYTRHRLRVRVNDQDLDQGPWAAAEVECRETRVVRGRDVFRPVGAPVVGPVSGDLFFQVDPGRTYEVRAVNAGEVLDAERLVVQDSDYETLVVLRPRSPTSGEARVAVASGPGPEHARTERDAEETYLDSSLVVVLRWVEGVPAGVPLPEIEASLARLVEGREPEAQAVSWLPVLPEAQPQCVRTSPLPDGAYRLRLRSDGVVFHEVQATIVEEVPPVLWVEIPAPKDRAPFAR